MESIIQENRIHFYQYIQVEILQQYVRQGIYYLINTIVNSTDRLIYFRYYTKQITAIFDFFKDYYMLKIHKATFAQHFYQLKRENSNGKPISYFKNAFLWAIIPYLIQKIQSYYNNLVNEQHIRELSLFEKVFTTSYPYLYALISLTQIIMKFKYLLSDHSIYFDIIYWLCKVKTTYKQAKEGEIASKWPIAQFFKSPGLLCLLLSHKILTFYFNMKKKKSADKIQGIEIQSPFSNLKDIRKLQKNICPICGQSIVNAALLRCSGYVYCYTCISQYVEVSQSCPMTKIKCTIENIQLIYP